MIRYFVAFVKRFFLLFTLLDGLRSLNVLRFAFYDDPRRSKDVHFFATRQPPRRVYAARGRF